MFNGCKVSVEEDEKVLKMGSISRHTLPMYAESYT
jgi:hypothetical protein